MTPARVLVAASCVLWMSALLSAQAQVTSPLNKHNLSISGPGPVKSTSMTEICVFCHTPHNANPAAALWNQALSTATYTPYTSSTMSTIAGVPTAGSSKLCMSCHDGTVALGSTVAKGSIPMQGLAAGRLTGPSVIGPNLGNHHPIAFVPATGPEIVNPAPGSPVKLDTNGQVQCVTCHDPHRMDADGVTKKFLVASNASSALCLACHRVAYWATNPGSHQSSTKPYAAAQGAHTGYTTVATNGCESCHKPHGAGAPARTLKAQEEMTCGGNGSQCHTTTGIGRNIESEFAKAYRHPTYSITPSVHDAAEGPRGGPALPEVSAATPRHAECSDCHNAHASYAAVAGAPKASGKLAGVWGVGRTGAPTFPSGTPPSVNEYEICFKCHGDSANMPQAGGTPYPPYPDRVAGQWNKRLQFDPTSVSYHPIEAAARVTRAPSLKAPWTMTSIVSCTDCHDNDTGPNAPTPGAGPSGPHGSNFKHLLAGRYEMDNATTPESAQVYALCYKCHDRNIILSNTSNPEHKRHIVDIQAPCSVCHDAHGVTASQGTTTNNSHLVNFDRRFVTPSSGGVLRFEQTGLLRGRCYLTCHGRNHNPFSY